MAPSSAGPAFFRGICPADGPHKELFQRSWAVDVPSEDSTRAEQLEKQLGGLPAEGNIATWLEQRSEWLKPILDEQGAPLADDQGRRPSHKRRIELLQQSTGQYAAALAVVEFITPHSDDDEYESDEDSDKGPLMLTVLALPVVGAISGFSNQELAQLPQADQAEVKALQYEGDGQALYPLMATVVRDTRDGTASDTITALEESLDSLILAPQGHKALVPTLIPSTAQPAKDSAEVDIWVSMEEARELMGDKDSNIAMHKSRRAASRFKGFLYAAPLAWLPLNHSMPLGLAMDPTKITSGQALKAVLIDLFGGDIGRWDYLTETTYYDAMLAAMSEDPKSLALPVFSAQQIATTWKAAVYPANKSKVPPHLQLTFSHMMCKLQALAFRDRLFATIKNANTLKTLRKYEEIGEHIVAATDDSTGDEESSASNSKAGLSDIAYVYGKVQPATRAWETTHGFQEFRSRLPVPACVEEYETMQAPTSVKDARQGNMRLKRKSDPPPVEEDNADEESALPEEGNATLHDLFKDFTSPTSTAQKNFRGTAPAVASIPPMYNTPQADRRNKAPTANREGEDSKLPAKSQTVKGVQFTDVQYERTIPAPSPFEPNLSVASTTRSNVSGPWILAMDKIPGIREHLEPMSLKAYMPQKAPDSRVTPLISAQAIHVQRSHSFNRKELLTSHILAHVIPLNKEVVHRAGSNQSIASSICLQPGNIGGLYHTNVKDAGDKADADIAEFLSDELDMLKHHAIWPAYFSINRDSLRNPRMLKALRQAAWVVGDHIATPAELDSGLSPGHMIATVNVVDARNAKNENIFRIPANGFRAEQIVQMLSNGPALMQIMTKDLDLYPSLPGTIGDLGSPLYPRSPVVGAIYSITEYLRQPFISALLNQIYEKHGTVDIVAMLIVHQIRLLDKIRIWSRTRPEKHYIKVSPHFDRVRDDFTLLYSKYNDGSEEADLPVTFAGWIQQLIKELSKDKLQSMLDAASPASTYLSQLPALFHPLPAQKPSPQKKRTGQPGQASNPKGTKEQKKDATGEQSKTVAEVQAELEQRECKHANEILIRFAPTSPTQETKKLAKFIAQLKRDHQVQPPKIGNKQACFAWLMEGGCPGIYLKKTSRKTAIAAPCGGNNSGRLHQTNFTKEVLQPLWNYLQNEHVQTILQPTDKFREIMA